MIVGIDCGNNNVNLVSASNRLTFQRFVMKSKFRAIEDGSEKWKVAVDGKEFFIGPLAEAEGAAMAFERNKAFHEHTIPLVFGAIAIAFKSPLVEVKIVSGLPLVDLKNQADTYRRLLLGDHVVNVNGRGNQKIVVEDVKVFGEGAGAIWDSVLDMNGRFRRKPQKWERVIDIGYRTVDFCTLKDMFYVADQSTSIPLGVYHAQMDTFKRVVAERDVLPEQVEPDDISIRDLAQQIISRMNKIWMDKDNIMLAGGGAYLLSKYLPYPMMNEPEWANASGYYKVGVITWHDRQ